MIDARPAPCPAIVPISKPTRRCAIECARGPAAAVGLHAGLREDPEKTLTAFALSTAMSTMQVSCPPSQQPSYSPPAGRVPSPALSVIGPLTRSSAFSWMQGRRHQHLPRRSGNPQTSEAGVGLLRRSDVQCADRRRCAHASLVRVECGERHECESCYVERLAARRGAARSRRLARSGPAMGAAKPPTSLAQLMRWRSSWVRALCAQVEALAEPAWRWATSLDTTGDAAGGCYSAMLGITPIWEQCRSPTGPPLKRGPRNGVVCAGARTDSTRSVCAWSARAGRVRGSRPLRPVPTRGGDEARGGPSRS